MALENTGTLYTCMIQGEKDTVSSCISTENNHRFKSKDTEEDPAVVQHTYIHSGSLLDIKHYIIMPWKLISKMWSLGSLTKCTEKMLMDDMDITMHVLCSRGCENVSFASALCSSLSEGASMEHVCQAYRGGSSPDPTFKINVLSIGASCQQIRQMMRVLTGTLNTTR